MKKFLFVLLIFIIPIIFFGCNKETVKPAKVIRVGTSMIFPPFEFIEKRNKGVTGFDIDLMNAIGNELGYQIVYHDIDYDDLFNVLEKGNIDVVISAVSVNDERKVRADFTKPYYASGITLAVLNTTKNIRGFNDLPGKKVAVVLGTTAAIEMSQKKSIDIRGFSTSADAFHALLKGEVDAIVNGKPIIDYYINTNNASNIKLLPGIYKQESYSIAVRKDNEELYRQIEGALQKIKDKGIYNKIYDKWFGEKMY